MKSPQQTAGNHATARQYNSLRADASGGANLLAHNILGIVKLPTNASNGNTLTLIINGSSIVITLVSGTPASANDVKIGATGTATIQNIFAFVQNSSANTTTQVAASVANQQLLSYAGFAAKDTNLVIFSLNNTNDAPLTSFTASTTVTAGTYEASTLKLYIQSGVFYVGTTKVEFSGSPTGTFTAPSANPRIDLLTIGTANAITITQGSESATPVAPTYPTDKVVLCEVYNRVGQTQILDNDNQGTSQGYILKDTRPYQSIMYINDANQIADGVITAAKLGNAGTVPTGTVTPYAGPTGTVIAGWLECTGTAVSRTTYATLFGVIGTAFGAGDGSTTFNVPDLRSRIPLGAGTGAGTRTGTATGTGTPTGTPLSTFSTGQWGGIEHETHAHGITTIAGKTDGPDGRPPTSTDQTDVYKMQPFLVLNFIIKT